MHHATQDQTALRRVPNRQMGENVIYYVYWIRQDHHTDPLTEGYIGVSKEPDRRFRYHACLESNNNDILYKAIKKGATQEILYEYANKEAAYAKEIEMRPEERIGYNLIPGGDSKPPVHYGNNWYRFTGKQPKASCVSCQKVLSWHQVANHTCRKQCARDGCNNRVTKITNTYCSRSCSATEWQRMKYGR